MARGKTRTGLSTKVTGDVIRRHALVRALWLGVINDPDRTVQDVSVEFFYAVGKALEGKLLSDIELREIDCRRVAQHIKDP